MKIEHLYGNDLNLFFGFRISDGKSDSFQFLQRGDESSEYFWDLFFKGVIIGYTMTTVLVSGASALLTVMTNGIFDTENMYHPHRLRCQTEIPFLFLHIFIVQFLDQIVFSLFWNQKTPLGYFAEIIFDIIVGDAYLMTNGTFLLLLVSMCLVEQAFYQIFEHYLIELSYIGEKPKKINHLCALIRFHNTVKR